MALPRKSMATKVVMVHPEVADTVIRLLRAAISKATDREIMANADLVIKASKALTKAITASRAMATETAMAPWVTAPAEA